jgi:indole-3-glycerol phosphate synthase
MILDDILAHKRDEVAHRRQTVPASALRDQPLYHEARRGFRAALDRAQAPAVIAELKRASPSRGVIRANYEPVAHARSYAAAGATCCSVLTDERFFQGSLDHLRAARAAVALPCLRKDFLVDPYQVDEARAAGADAVLVIAAAGMRPLGEELLAAAETAGLDVLVEVHDERELEWANAVGARLIGINNRDLTTFVTSLATTERLAPLAHAGALVVAESGIRTPADVARMRAAGARALLVGEALMDRPDPGAALEELLACR